MNVQIHKRESVYIYIYIYISACPYIDYGFGFVYIDTYACVCFYDICIGMYA